MAYGTVNADVVGTSVTGSNLGAGNASIMKNRIINGAMVISQYNGTSSSIPADGAYTLDRWQYIATQASKFTAQQNAGSVTTPVGFVNYLGMSVSSAVSIGVGDIFGIRQHIEGYNVADLGWGTASAKTVCLSFQVYSSLTGTFGGSLRNSAANRSYPFSYTISSANTWTTISITIAGDTSGTWLTNNGRGITLTFGLGVGSTGSGTAGSWASADYYSATGATSVVGTNGATFYITGCQLEVGSSQTGYEYRNFQQELALCQRYFWKITKTNPYTGILNVAAFGGSDCYGVVTFPVPMRTLPTGSYSSLSAFRIAMAGSTTGPSGITFQDPSTFNTVINLNRSVTSGDAGWVSFNDPSSSSTDFFAWSAEL